ncbi:MAG: Pullulanase precursor [Planctomycetota bacterium]|jgi:pullulanase
MHLFQTVIVAVVLIAGSLCSAGQYVRTGAAAPVDAALPVTGALPDTPTRPFAVARPDIAASLATAAPPTTGVPKRTAFDPATFGAKQLLVVHYARTDENYTAWNVWAWVVDQTGQQLDFKGVDDYGPYAIMPLRVAAPRVGFIVRKGEWEAKDIDADRFVDLNDRRVTEVWLRSGDAVVHTAPPVIDRTLRLTAAFLDARNIIMLASTTPLDVAQQKRLVVSSTANGKPINVVSAKPVTVPGAEGSMTRVELARSVKDDEISSLSVAIGTGSPSATAPKSSNTEPATVRVFARGVLEDPVFVAADAELGARCTPERTVFRTWSPVSTKVELLINDNPQRLDTRAPIQLTRGAHGVWETTVTGDLHGKGYSYRFTHYGDSPTVPDIHAFAATADSTRSAIVDLDRLKPANWDSTPVPLLARATDEVIYEIHVRDFSVADQTCPPEIRGTYRGLAHGGRARDGHGTGINHLKELGITAVHLMPVQDFSAAPNAYNWGYWTALFNVPESNYASDQSDPLAAIREFRTAIEQLHSARLRVIMDVAYNHTSSSGSASPFDGTVPYWFFRTTPDGRYSNDAGCGNSVADERPMVRKYIMDSLAFWLTQYKVDGFRFDLLGTHTPETARAACALVKRLRPDATLYGEPWTGGGPIRFGKGAQKGLPLGVFNDNLRTAIRGDTDGAVGGFAINAGGSTGANTNANTNTNPSSSSSANGITVGAMGAIDDFTSAPAESINYASAHDNLSLVDKIAKTAPDADVATRRAMQKLAIGIVLVSQGVPFIEGGSEICRTKQGNHNSYEAGDAINQFDWVAAEQCRDVSDWVAGMIAIRAAHPVFRMDNAADIRASCTQLQAAPLLAWTLNGAASKDSARQLIVVLNGDPVERQFTLPPGEWSVLADANTASATPHGSARGVISLRPHSMFVAAQLK